MLILAFEQLQIPIYTLIYFCTYFPTFRTQCNFLKMNWYYIFRLYVGRKQEKNPRNGFSKFILRISQKDDLAHLKFQYV